MNDTCALRINGSLRAASCDAADTLLTVLRDQFALLGAKCGCNQGVCGACTVLVNGYPVRACLSLASDCEGSDIITVEALERDALGARLQRAFAEFGAVQCGFCTSGMLISAYRLLSQNAQPTTEDIRRGLSGNLCRCTGYRKIVDAIMNAAKERARS